MCRYKIFWILLLLPLLSACRKDKGIALGEEVDVQIVLNKDQASPENEVRSLRLMLFDLNKSGKPLLTQEVFVPEDVYDASTQSYILNVKVRRRDHLQLSVIANEQEQWNLGDIESVATHSELQSKLANYAKPSMPSTLHLEAPFVMFCDASLTVAADEGPIVKRSYDLVRQIAKVSINLKIDVDFKIDMLDHIKLAIKDLPLLSALSPTFNINNRFSFFTDIPEAIQSIDADFTLNHTTQQYELNVPLVYYIPEHLYDPHELYTALSRKTEITLSLLSLSGSAIKDYLIPIGEHVNKLYRDENPLALTDLKGEDLCIHRNTHFVYDITLSKKKQEVHITYLPWTDVAIHVPIERDPYLNVSSLETSLTYVNTFADLQSSQANILFWSNIERSEIEIIDEAIDNLGNHFALGDVLKASIGDLSETGQTNGTISLELAHPALTYATVGLEYYQIVLKAKNLRRTLKVKVPQFPTSTFDELPWVGVFYTNEQKGERVIFARHTGAWSVTVEYPSSNTDGPYVLLSDQLSSDGFLWTSTPSDAESFTVVGSQTVSGTGDVYFRVGLSSSNPRPTPRYAKLSLTTDAGVKTIYIRQGEAFDYLMRPTDMFTNGSSRNGKCRKPAVANVSILHYPPFTQLRSSRSQIGKVYIPSVPSESTPLAPWNNRQESTYDFWLAHPFFNTYSTSNKTFTNVGWKTSGDIFPESEQVTIEEIQASLLEDHEPNPSVRNYQWGLMADGYMDRLARKPLLTSDIDGNIVTLMATTEAQGEMHSRGYPGMLFFNRASNSYASVFLPMQGRRIGNTLKLEHAGLAGYYWSTTQNTSVTNQVSALKMYYLNGQSYVQVVHDEDPNQYFSLRSFAFIEVN